MADEVTIDQMLAYAAQLEAAAAKSNAASDVQHQIVHGDATQDVNTESGAVPSLAKQAVQAQEKVTSLLADISSQLGGAAIYPSIAKGLEKTTNGGIFSVRSTTDGRYVDAYENVAGTAVYFDSYPNADAVKALEDDPQRPRAVQLATSVEQLLMAIVAQNYTRTALEIRASDGGFSERSMSMTRERLGTLWRSFPGILMAMTDANGVLTDLSVRDTDGQVPDWVIKRWATRISPLAGDALGVKFASFPGVLASLTDSKGMLTDIVVRDTDGQIPDWVIARWAPRLAPLLADQLGLRDPKVAAYFLPDVRGTTSDILGSDTYEREGEVLPVLTNMQQWAGWGSSTIAQFEEMTALAAEFGASYYNGGQGSEWSTHGAARLGSIPALLTVDSGSIPAEAGYALPVSCSNVRPASYFRQTDGYLNGVRGTLKATNDGFTFNRTTAGVIVTVSGEVPFIPVDGPLYRAALTFLNLGKNDIQSNQTAESVIKRTDASYKWLSPLVKRVIVMGQFCNTNTPAGSVIATRLASINQHCSQKYGRQFFDLGGYLTSAQIWTDTGVTPTATDLEQQAIGNIPPSLAAGDGAHMLPVARAAVALKLKAIVLALGWY